MKLMTTFIATLFLLTAFAPSALAAGVPMGAGQKMDATRKSLDASSSTKMNMKKMGSMNKMKKKMKSMSQEMSLFGMDSLASGLRGLNELGIFQSMVMGKTGQKKSGSGMDMKKPLVLKGMAMGSIFTMEDDEDMEDGMKAEMAKKMKQEMKKKMKKKMQKKMQAEMDASMASDSMIQMPTGMGEMGGDVEPMPDEGEGGEGSGEVPPPMEEPME